MGLHARLLESLYTSRSVERAHLFPLVFALNNSCPLTIGPTSGLFLGDAFRQGEWRSRCQGILYDHATTFSADARFLVNEFEQGFCIDIAR